MIRHCLRPTLALVSFLLLLGGCGKAPIEEAVGKNDRQAVAEAIKAGADVNARTSSGDTALMAAAKSAQSSSAQALIENGADIQVKDNAIRIAGTKSVNYSDKASLHRRERAAGRFDRAVTIPVRIDAGRVKAEYHDGVLALYLPRAEQDKPRSVKVA